MGETNYHLTSPDIVAPDDKSPLGSDQAKLFESEKRAIKR